MEDWAEIRRLHRAEGMSIKEIARRVGVSRNTVRSALRAEGPPRFERAPRAWAVDAVEPAIRALLAEFPRMPATVIAERIGWERSMTHAEGLRVAELRPLFVPPDPVQRTEYRPGELAQWDLWFPAVGDPRRCRAGGPATGDRRCRRATRVGWSARMIPSRQAHDILCGHLGVLVELGGVPAGSGCMTTRRRSAARHGGRAKPTEAFQPFRGTLGMGAVFCKPGDPEAKGLVERANGYLETSFLPGRRFDGVADFNAQLAALAAARRTTGIHAHAAVPARRADRRGPRGRCWRSRRCCPTRRCGSRRGSPATTTCGSTPATTRCNPRAIGRRVEVRVDLDEVVVHLRRRRGRPPSALAGPSTAPSPTRATWPPARALRRARRRRRSTSTTSRNATSPSTTGPLGVA